MDCVSKRKGDNHGDYRLAYLDKIDAYSTSAPQLPLDKRL